jgi:hypothetical protein
MIKSGAAINIKLGTAEDELREETCATSRWAQEYAQFIAAYNQTVASEGLALVEAKSF